MFLNSTFHNSSELASQLDCKPVMIWNVEDCVNFLKLYPKDVNQEFIKVFIGNRVTGQTLLDLDHKQLRLWGIPSYKDRSALLKLIKNKLCEVKTKEEINNEIHHRDIMGLEVEEMVDPLTPTGLIPLKANEDEIIQFDLGDNQLLEAIKELEENELKQLVSNPIQLESKNNSEDSSNNSIDELLKEGFDDEDNNNNNNNIQHKINKPIVPPSRDKNLINLNKKVNVITNPIINPRKESMINLERTLPPNKESTLPPPPYSNLSRRSHEHLRVNNRRSSLLYEPVIQPRTNSKPINLRVTTKSNDLNNVNIISNNISNISNNNNINQFKPNKSPISNHPSPNKLKPISPTTNNPSFLGNLLPGLLTPFRKGHTRKMSWPEPSGPIQGNKVVQVSCQHGSLYSVNVGGCLDGDSIYRTILTNLGITDFSHQYQVEEVGSDLIFRPIPLAYLWALCQKSDHKGLVRLHLTKLEGRKFYSEGRKRSDWIEPINKEQLNKTIGGRIGDKDYCINEPIKNEILNDNNNNNKDLIEKDKNDDDNNNNNDNTPGWAQMWGDRPPTEVITTNLDQYFPGHDLDNPIIELPTPVTTPNTSQTIELVHTKFRKNEIGRKRSIRMVVQEHQRYRLSQTDMNLGRRSTKLWGNKITQLESKRDRLCQTQFGDDTINDKEIISKPDEINLNQSNLNSNSKLQESSNEFPFDKLQKRSSTQIHWVKGKMIGKGSFGKVYHALNALTGEMIAVKSIDLPSNPSSLITDLYQEIQLLKDLDHDHIVQYLGFESDNLHIHLFLEYIPGGSISSQLVKFGKFEEKRASKLLKQVVSGLVYLHNKGILHRDIKAANILLDNCDNCKISDFGISKKGDYAHTYQTTRNSFKGTVFWMAPEIVINQGYSAKIDIWALGCLLIEMLTAQRPWKNLNELAAVYRLGKSGPESAPPIPDTIGDHAKFFLERCFTIQPDQRPTAKQLEELEFLN